MLVGVGGGIFHPPYARLQQAAGGYSPSSRMVKLGQNPSHSDSDELVSFKGRFLVIIEFSGCTSNW